MTSSQRRRVPPIFEMWTRPTAASFRLTVVLFSLIASVGAAGCSGNVGEYPTTNPGTWTFEKASALMESLGRGFKCGKPGNGWRDVMECRSPGTTEDWGVAVPSSHDAWAGGRSEACAIQTPSGNRLTKISLVTDGSSLFVWELFAREGGPVDAGPAIAATLAAAGVNGLRVEPFCPK